MFNFGIVFVGHNLSKYELRIRLADGRKLYAFSCFNDVWNVLEV